MDQNNPYEAKRRALQEQFMAGEMTWQEYEDRLREVGNG